LLLDTGVNGSGTEAAAVGPMEAVDAFALGPTEAAEEGLADGEAALQAAMASASRTLANDTPSCWVIPARPNTSAAYSPPALRTFVGGYLVGVSNGQRTAEIGCSFVGPYRY